MQIRGLLWRTLALSFALGAPARAAASDLPPVLADSIGRERGLAELARLAVEDDDATAQAARQRLRAAGPAGLAAFERAHAAALTAASDAYLAAADAPVDRRDPADLADPARARLLGALDAVCGQRDCVLSRLYWHTDLDEAVRTARREGKPVLSLRLLGDLRDELSCANSRFFRAILYPDPAVRAVLRDRFVLHWASERPAPKITVDLGDGRQIVTTITGNSAHFVLDPGGRPVDVVPGLYAPADFVAALQRAEALARRTAVLTGEALREALADHHEARVRALDEKFKSLARAAGQRVRPLPRAPRPGAGDLRAGQAAPLAISKMAVEAPLLGATGEPVDRLAERWERIADVTTPAVELSRASLGLMRTQQWRSGDPTRDAGDRAAAIVALRRTLALDTLRNEQEIHREIHRWWARGATAPRDLQSLVRRVYDELFMTPARDPWLGLADPSLYGGLVGGGRRTQAHL
ncbi:hypothetical protein SAMN02745121_01374 [Nannocystis exedens]|uniref:Uncharacterized protein n=1 Tax=Nannocystis exedens TaxID=54 RepID=A0A1I1UX23_9BACT|nr:thioredoxin family protein [Nannocystis exedens]PCC72165.1 hypothetical protein NAEX_05244 [Nannocystis exedens]SFD75361.1 hypothetical protein SAMN02745121_01374 [Nannocystis exedens]